MNVPTEDSLSGSSYPATACWFAAGGAVTAIFSGSLARLTTHAGLAEVLAIGMVVPCFTWAVQLSASAMGLSPNQRRAYWADLGRVCLLGSVALLPAAIVNLCLPHAPRWFSTANVLGSVAVMAADLFRRSVRHGIAFGWPLSWCVTIAINMALFLWASWRWWL